MKITRNVFLNVFGFHELIYSFEKIVPTCFQVDIFQIELKQRI